MKKLSFLLLLPSLALAQVPHRFNNGEVADAEKINENFVSIDEALKAIGPPATFTFNEGIFKEILVDCEANPEALQAELGVWVASVDRLKVNIKGECQITSDFDALKSIGEAFRQVIMAGASNIGEFAIRGGCANTSKIVSPGAIRLGTTAGSLDVSCITFDAPSGTYISAFGNGYVRFEDGVQTASEDQLLTMQIRNNSTFRTFYNNRIDAITVRNQSLANFNSDINIGDVILEGASMMSCRFCGDGIIASARLRQGSNMTFLGQAGAITITTLEARERSQLNVELYQPPSSSVTVGTGVFQDESASYQSVYGQ